MGLNTLFKALSDNTRREILRLLTDKDLTAGEIAEAFDLSRATISHHLSVLKEAGLILDERRGPYIIYSLNTTVFQEVAGWVFDVTRTLLNKEQGKSKTGIQTPRHK
ncbi:MAG: winged helix-turn-helix transcriptional regulator [Peptococcaceae bacterium]|nr:winged helix-turn-helix transcriptional regulator [Peptococcaceae bacterium]